MAVTPIRIGDLARDVGEVARERAAWKRGEPDEAALETLTLCAGQLHGRSPTVWAWTGSTAAGEPAAVLPVPAAATIGFAPKGPAAVLVRLIEAAIKAGADPDALRFEEWRGQTCMVCPGMEPELLDEGYREANPATERISVAALPGGVVVGGPVLLLAPLPGPRGEGLAALARELSVHPVQVAVALIAHNQPVHGDQLDPALLPMLRGWGCAGRPAPVVAEPPSLDIDDDPCPRRRHARKVLQRLMRMKKVGEGYHTEFDHLYRGAAPHERRQALEVGEALLRAGLLGEKPSVGQRHIYLRREALPEIHALIDRGETRDPGLAELWTAPPPGAARRPTAGPPARSP
jgi:hypothetical protein